MKLRVGPYHIIRTLPEVNLKVQLSHGHWSLKSTEEGAQTHHLVGQIDLIVQIGTSVKKQDQVSCALDHFST